jgi:predicted Zn-dependent peptidase
MLRNPEVFTLDNGIRVVHQYSGSAEVVHCGIFINAGTRDEQPGEKGLAHFIEHVMFKGTATRKPFHILNRLETVGGELNAYTTKEEICVHASIMSPYFERAAELISDIAFHSIFPEKELEKEKEVIIDEIRSCQDNPSEQIYDDFEELVFRKHPLGTPILGTVETVRSFSRADVTGFIGRVYGSNQIVFASVGNVSPEKVKKVAARYFSQYRLPEVHLRKKAAPAYAPVEKTEKKSNYQAHCMLGNVAYSYHDPKRTALILLNNLLGGPGMNSRLNLSLREKHGIAYNIYSSYTNYSDTGCFSIYIGTDGQNIARSIDITMKELKKLREVKLGALQLSQAKQQLIGQIAIAQESRIGLMQVLGKSLLNYNKIESLPEVYAKINGLTSESLQEVANEVLDEKRLSRLVYVN